MVDSFLFEALRGGTADEPTGDLSEVARTVGWAPVGARGTATRLASGDVRALLRGADERRRWSVTVTGSDLGFADGRPDEPAQDRVVELLEALLRAAPPWAGVSCWPFGPVAPEVYDSETPFALRQVGAVLFLSDDYVRLQLPGVDLADAPVSRRTRVDGGTLLVAGDLLRSAEDGQLDGLRQFLGLSPTAG